MDSNLQRIVIARFCGWNNVRSTSAPYIIWGIDPDTGYEAMVPNYASDLNAMFKAEKKLDSERDLDYSENLARIVGAILGSKNSSDIARMRSAPAEARAQALLETLNIN